MKRKQEDRSQATQACMMVHALFYRAATVHRAETEFGQSGTAAQSSRTWARKATTVECKLDQNRHLRIYQGTSLDSASLFDEHRQWQSIG